MSTIASSTPPKHPKPAPSAAPAGSFSRAHLAMVLATCRRILGRTDLAEDAAQEVYLQALRTPPAGDGDTAAWLHRVAVNKAISLRRREHALRARAIRSAQAGPAPSTPPAPMLADAEIDEVLDGLAEADRSLLIACYLDGQSQEQIAARLGLSQSAVSRRVRAATAAARQLLRARGVPVDRMGMLACLAGHHADVAPTRLILRLPRGVLRTIGAASSAAIASVLTLILVALCVSVRSSPSGQRDAASASSAAVTPSDRPPPTPIEQALGERAQRGVSLVLRGEWLPKALDALSDALPPGDELDTRIAFDQAYSTQVSLDAGRPRTVEDCLNAIAGACTGTWRSIRGVLVLTQPMTDVERTRWLQAFRELRARLHGLDAVQRQPMEATALMGALEAPLQRIRDDPAALDVLAHAAFNAREPRLRDAALTLFMEFLTKAMSGQQVGTRPIPATLANPEHEADLDASIIAGLGPGSDARTRWVSVWLAGSLGRTTTHRAMVQLIQRSGARSPDMLIDSAFEALQVIAQPEDAADLEAIAAATQSRAVAMACARALSAIGGAQEWRYLQSICDPRLASQLIGGNHLGTTSPLWLATESVARPYVLPELASWGGEPVDRADPCACLARWGHRADARLLLEALPSRASVPYAFARALGRLADAGMVPRLASVLRSLPPQRAAELEAGTARLSRRKPARDGALQALARTLGAGLASCPDPGFWSTCERSVADERDPLAQALAATALACSHREREPRALIVAARSERDPEQEAILACAAGQLDLPEAQQVLLSAVSDRRLPAIARATIVDHARNQELPLATLGLAVRHDAALAVPIWTHLHALPRDQGTLAQVASMIADRAVDGRARGYALALARGRCGDAMAYVRDDDAFVRGCALFCIAARRVPATEALLVERLRDDPSAVARRVAASALCFLQEDSPETARALLAAVVGDADQRTRILAARSLCVAVGCTWKKPLRDELKSALASDLRIIDDPAVRDAIGEVLTGSCHDDRLDVDPCMQFDVGCSNGQGYCYSLQCCLPDADAAEEDPAPALGGGQS